MNLLTLSEAREALWRYGSPTASSYASATPAELQTWTDRCNRVVEIFFSKMKPAHTYRRIYVPIYDEHITLPRNVESIMGIKPVNANGCPCSPLFIYSRFHEFAMPVSDCSCCAPAAIPVTEMAQTFRDPAPGFRLRLKSTTGATGTYTFFGGRNEDYDEYFDSVQLSITNGTTTTTRVWNTLPRMLKSVTTVGVEVYSVDEDDEETLIAVHAPGETSPAYQRYHVPHCSQFVAALVLTRLTYVKMTLDTDIVIPSLMAALSQGLLALQYEDESNLDQRDRCWAEALDRLDSQKQQLEGESELPAFSSVPEFGASQFYAPL